MKKIVSYIQLIMYIFCLSYLVGCKGNNAEDAETDLTLKAFSPSVVMEGGQMTIVGSSLDKVNNIIFPGNVEVKNFKLLTSNQIELSIPSGISDEGGHLVLVSDDGNVESSMEMRIAKPEIKSMLPGDEVGVGQELSIKGIDLQYTDKIIFPSEQDGENITIEAIDFMRKASEDIKIIVPKGVKSGNVQIKLVSINDETIVSSPIKITDIAASNKLQTNVYYTIWEDENGLQFPGGWNLANLTFRSDYFGYIEKEGYEFKIYFTYTGTKAGGVGIHRQNSPNDCVYYAEADNTKFGQKVERQESRYPKDAHVELLTCTSKGPDYAVIMGGNEIVLYKIEILFTKIP